MTSTDDLFQLIKSLSKAEKAHISRFSQYYIRREGNNYMRLFKAIEKQEQYDEKSLKAQFKGERFLNQFWVAKNYLHNYILKCLETFHESVDGELRSMLQQVDVLIEKELYLICGKILKKGKKMAERYERYTYLFEFLRKEDYCLYAQSYLGISGEELHKLYLKSFEALANSKTILDYYLIRINIYNINMKQGMVRKISDQDVYKKAISNKLFKSPDSIKMFEPKAMVLATYSGFYHNTGQPEKANKFVWQRLKHYDDHPDFKMLHAFSYVAIIYDVISSCIQLKKFDKVPDLIEKMKNFKGGLPANEERFFSIINYAELTYLFAIKNYEALRNFTQKFQLELKARKELKKNIVSITLFYNIGKMSFLIGDYKTSKTFFNNVLTNFPSTLRIDYHIFSRLLLLLTYFETYKLDLIEYELKYAERFINKKERLYKVEKAMVAFFRKAITMPDNESKLQKEYKSLEAELKESIKDTTEKNALSYFNFLSWTESKLKGKDILKIYS